MGVVQVPYFLDKFFYQIENFPCPFIEILRHCLSISFLFIIICFLRLSTIIYRFQKNLIKSLKEACNDFTRKKLRQIERW